jgi:hypothetical protein
MATAAHALFQEAVEKGLGEMDFAVIAQTDERRQTTKQE